jgi:acetylglutamate kinase
MPKPVSVVKIGGTLITSSGAPDTFWQSVVDKQTQNELVIVHGGGAHATRAARLIGHEPRFVHGRRVTSEMDLEIVQWTMRGALNVRLVSQALQHRLMAVGLCGADGGMVRVHRRPPRTIDDEVIDFGFVGDVDEVDVDVLRLLVSANRLPIIAPMGIDRKGQLYNVNADTVAMQIAAALSAGELLLVTDSGGVRRQPDDARSVLRQMSPLEQQEGIDRGWISGGMRAKLEAAREALAMGIATVRIVGAGELGNPEAGTRVVS